MQNTLPVSFYIAVFFSAVWILFVVIFFASLLRHVAHILRNLRGGLLSIVVIVFGVKRVNSVLPIIDRSCVLEKFAKRHLPNEEQYACIRSSICEYNLIFENISIFSI